MTGRFFRKTLSFSLLAGMLVFPALLSPVPVQAQGNDKVTMTPYLRGPSEDLVERIWRKDPEYKEYIDVFDYVPSHHTGEADLNGDGVKEIIVRHMDDLYKFCTPGAEYTCRAHIYMIKNNQVLEIGRFMAGPDIVLGDTKTNGFRDILTQDKDRRLITFAFDGERYVQK